MPLRLKNTLTKSIDTFVPLDPSGEVLLYSCGPTVYSYAHIGNFRSFLVADLLRRVLERGGYRVRHVMNITDVGHMTEDHLADASGEDKLSKAARELGWDPFQVARHFEQAFVEDATTLRLKNYLGDEATDAKRHPRATDFIPEMLVLVQRLLEQGFAYLDEEGQAYFEIQKFPEYGQLSGKPIDELEAGARVEVRDGKRDPRDFALWKVDKKHLMQWDPHTGAGFRGDDFARLQRLMPSGVDPKLGRGFPGWHIECSAMARACLADVIDIHTGGEDNLFPHHECETAQTCCALGVSVDEPASGGSRKNFARYWLHGRHLLVDDRKMSKRDGTFYTVRNLLDPAGSGRPELVAPLAELGFADGRVPPAVLRLALMSCSFTLPMNFGLDALVQARATVGRIQSRYDRLREVAGSAAGSAGDPALAEALALAIEQFEPAFGAALDDNLDFPAALVHVHAFVTALNRIDFDPPSAERALAAIERMDEILDVLERKVSSGVLMAAELGAWQGELPDDVALAGLTELDQTAIEQLIGARYAAKKQRQFERADALRRRLKELGVSIEDLPGGNVRWKLD